MRKYLILTALGALLAGSAGLVYAQLEGSDRGIPPVDSTSNFEVTDIQVDVSAGDADSARQEGWKVAQRLGWKKLWSRTVGRPEDQAPDLADNVLNQIVSGIVIEEEQIGPTRYVAKLGLLFDRARTGQMLGVGGVVRRSAPLLVIPLMRTGSTGYALEFRSPWQYAWAQFRTSTSPIDYVRPVGTGIDPLLLNAAQTGRRSRGWWRTLLDQYGASDVVVPEVQLIRAYPGGPAVARFTARYGPDNEVLGTFELRAEAQEQIQQMLAQGVQRMDAMYIQAFNAGLLRPDPTLIPPPAQFVPPPRVPVETRAPTTRLPADTEEVLTDEPTPADVPPAEPDTQRPPPEEPPAEVPR
jgi:hypothetical protein